MTDVDQKSIDKFLGYMRLLPSCAPSGLPSIAMRIDQNHPDVVLPDCAIKYDPESSITVIGIYTLYEDLIVEDDKFTVTLQFNGDPLVVSVPLTSIVDFIIGLDHGDVIKLYPKDPSDNIVDFQERRASV